MLLKSIPNILTLSRILVVPFFILMFYSNLFYFKLLSLFIFFLSSITDFLDGYLARKYNLVTSLGKFIDPLADKILILTAFFLLYSLYSEFIPLWMLFSIFIRDIGITLFRLYLNSRSSTLKTSYFAKTKTLFQIVVIHVLLIFHSFYPFNNSVFKGFYEQSFYMLMLLCVVFTVLSGLHYLLINSYKNA